MKIKLILFFQLDWVCEEDWKPVFSQSLFFLGALVGGPLFGWLADSIGRLPIIVVTNLMGGVAGIVSGYCNTFVSFTAARFIVGLTFDSHFMIAYMLSKYLLYSFFEY